MRRTASEIIRELEMRVAHLERQAIRKKANSLSSTTQAMMDTLANHSRSTPMVKRGNFNVLQEVLEALGFSYAYQDAQKKFDGRSQEGVDGHPIGFDAELKSVHPRLFSDFLRVEGMDESGAAAFLPTLLDDLYLLPRVSYAAVKKKPKTTPFGKVSIVFSEGFTHPPTARQGYETAWEVNCYVGAKKVVISKGSKKVTVWIYAGDDLTDFDFSKVVSFAIKQGAVQDAQSFVGPSASVQPPQPVLSLAEQGKGTCCFCGSIQKLTKRGKVHRHGYRAQGFGGWGGWSADCYGSNQLPIEASSDGLKHVKRLLNHDLTQAEGQLQAYVRDRKSMKQNNSTHNERRNYDAKIVEQKKVVAEIKKNIAYCDQTIANWRPQS